MCACYIHMGWNLSAVLKRENRSYASSLPLRSIEEAGVGVGGEQLDTLCWSEYSVLGKKGIYSIYMLSK